MNTEDQAKTKFNKWLSGGLGPSKTMVKKGGPLPSHLTIKLPTLSNQVKPIQVHNLVPGCHKIMYKLFVRICTGIHFGQRTQLGV